MPAFVKAFAKAMELHSYLLLSLINDSRQKILRKTEYINTHEIVTKGCPSYFRPRKLNPKILEATKEPFSQLLQNGRAREANSEYPINAERCVQHLLSERLRLSA